VDGAMEAFYSAIGVGMGYSMRRSMMFQSMILNTNILADEMFFVILLILQQLHLFGRLKENCVGIPHWYRVDTPNF
jgi:hypothetical protein